MLGPFPLLLVIVGLTMLSAGGLAWFFLYGRIEAENRAEDRLDLINARRSTIEVARAAAADPGLRRKSVQETLKELDERQKKARRTNAPTLSLRLEQAGLPLGRRGFLIASLGLAAVVAGLLFLFDAPLWAVAAFALAAGIALPRWIVSILRKRRIRKFLGEFANAVDVIVRGIKAGLPLNDCIRLIATEAAEPVRSEFRNIAETQAAGVSMAEAVGRLPARVPVSETNFFAIVIATQAKAGGSLSEALGNLSRVLRERLRMQGKIRAMSMEAKASAVIIGALPIAVMVLVYLTTPGYITVLFTHPVGHLILIGSAVWMTIGILVMRRMINFDF